MSFGDPQRGVPPWSLDEGESRTFIKAALDAGVTFFDTANFYSDGSSEEYVGRAVKSLTRREDVVIATKVWENMGPLPNGRGLSRGAILTQVDASLRRLGTDYIDLYVIHRADPFTPWEETLETLDDLVRAGKVRYLGASAMRAWQFAKALFLQQQHGWARFISMQNHYNLLYREEEREMVPLCLDQGVGVTPFSPLARGLLARPWDEVTSRSIADPTREKRYGDQDRPVVGALEEVAARHGVPLAHVALAWLMAKPGVVAPVVGTTKPHHLEDALAGARLQLTHQDMTDLERHYVPHAFNWIAEPEGSANQS
jgi:aryl-alcohol dehydrogenase-like predicted oxidoreductase